MTFDLAHHDPAAADVCGGAIAVAKFLGERFPDIRILRVFGSSACGTGRVVVAYRAFLKDAGGIETRIGPHSTEVRGALEAQFPGTYFVPLPTTGLAQDLDATTALGFFGRLLKGMAGV